MSGCIEYRRLSRRDFLGVGVAGALTLPQALRAGNKLKSAGTSTPAEMNAIFMWLGGGPTHIDLFDPKPSAPEGIRREFRPIPTSLPGCQLAEVLPRLARQMHHCSLVRSVTHNIGSHAPGSL